MRVGFSCLFLVLSSPAAAHLCRQLRTPFSSVQIFLDRRHHRQMPARALVVIDSSDSTICHSCPFCFLPKRDANQGHCFHFSVPGPCMPIILRRFGWRHRFGWLDLRGGSPMSSPFISIPILG